MGINPEWEVHHRTPCCTLKCSLLESYLRKSSLRKKIYIFLKTLKLVFNEVVNHDRSGLRFLIILPWCFEHDMAALSNANFMI